MLLDCTNNSEGMPQAIEAARVGARIGWVSIPGDDTVPINAHLARRKELTIQLVRRSVRCFPQGLRLIAEGKIDVRPLITHRFRFDEIGRAFALVEQYQDGVVKAMVHMPAGARGKKEEE